ncbi:MAG: FAD-dependent oxidoreductase [Syntrophorhabdaceae bacterium]|nr:FAD-dependent oxidoreductase [Syntrophorhabdaceae bacterium]
MGKKVVGKVLVIGGGIGGMEASLNLVEAGFKVYLADRKPNIGGNMAQLDKVFPTNDCSMCVMAPKLVEVGRDPNIELLMNSEVVAIEGEAGNFTVTLRTRPRRVLYDRCTSCGVCGINCPLEVGDVYNESLSLRSAAFINFPQAIPSTYMLDRQLSPCIFTCPINLNARDYISLIVEGKFLEALDLIREKLPFPGIIGRICAHPCEEACLRGKEVDQPIAICALKRFVADYELGKRQIPVPKIKEEREKRVAVIGGGPAGTTCAYELRKEGFRVTIFEAYDRLGGMLYVGVPAYRLPRDVLEREMSILEKIGIEVRYNTRVGKDIPLDHIFNNFDATFIGSGAHGRRRLGIENEDAQGVLDALSFLRGVNLGRAIQLGKGVIILGGGNVAMDAALTAKRCGAEEVTIVALERWEDMPAHRWEIGQALEEGIKIYNSWGPYRIHTRGDRFAGIELQRCLEVYNEKDEFEPVFDGSVTRYLQGDNLILVIYETIDTAYLRDYKEIERLSDGRIKVDRVTLETTKKGVFAGGNAVTGPKTAIDAISQGKRAAESIKRFLEGKDMREGRLAEDDKILDEPPFYVQKKPRVFIPRTPISERSGFAEINQCISQISAVEEARRCLSCRRCLGCGICEEVCKPEAIDYSQVPVETKVNVGSIIISTGYDEFNPRELKEYGYGICRNVLTSIEYERVLSATGPTESKIMRPSDGKIPKKIAFIQCVGSRCKINEYCSSVCCMYATEEAIISKEHQHDIEPTIFYMDIRTFGKGYEHLFEQARNKYGVRYIKSLVSRVIEDPETKDLEICFIDEAGSYKTEHFELVVLSIGLRPSKQLKQLADILDVKLNSYGFIETHPQRPLATLKEGIYLCGACGSPKDITETVIDGSGVACEASRPLKEARWVDIEIKTPPNEKDVVNEEPRIGVFICNCGVNIGGIVDVPGVKTYAEGLPGVVVAQENLFTCSQDTQEKIKKTIEEYNLNRVVVASCSTRTHEPLFRSLIRDAGLNKYLFEMANIRDQCSWVHMHEKEDATEKAKALVRMAVANAAKIEPLTEKSVTVERSCLVVGGGLAGMTSSLNLADQGFKVFLIEKEDELGGNLRYISTTLDKIDIQAFFRNLKERVLHHPHIEVMTGSTIKGHSGFKGNFETEITRLSDNHKEIIRHGATIIATGGEEIKPYGLYGYGEKKYIMTQMELESAIMENRVTGYKRCVMIQCVGSRDKQRPYCSRICCLIAIKNAIRLKEIAPDSDIIILYRDMMTYGFYERYYRMARQMGIGFIRFDASMPPIVEPRGDHAHVTCHDMVLSEDIEMEADIVGLSCAIIPRDNKDIANIFRLPRTPEGFFLEAHMKLKPIDFSYDGVYLAGMCHSPRTIKETIIQAEGAAARAITILAKDRIPIGGIVAYVDADRCAACLTCVRVCPFSVPFVNERGEAEIDINRCKGCGVCAAECPAKAIDVMHYRDRQIIEKTLAAVNT